MDQADQINAYYKDLEKLTERYRNEFNLTIAGAIGCLELMKYRIIKAGEEVFEDED